MSKKWLIFLFIAIIIFIGVAFPIFFYWNIEDSNRWSTFFSFTSTFGIVATVSVYFLQKNDIEKIKTQEKIKKIDTIKKYIRYAIKENIDNALTNKNELSDIKKALEQGKKNLDLQKNIIKLRYFNLRKLFYNTIEYDEKLFWIIENTIDVIYITNNRLCTIPNKDYSELDLCIFLIDEYTEAIRCLESYNYEL